MIAAKGHINCYSAPNIACQSQSNLQFCNDSKMPAFMYASRMMNHYNSTAFLIRHFRKVAECHNSTVFNELLMLLLLRV